MRAITPASIMAQRSPVNRPVTEVTSWLGARFLGEVPVLGGSATSDLSLIGGELEMQVPNEPGWVPTRPDHPLHRYGQELRVRRGWAASDGSVHEMITIGRYLIRRSVAEGDVITVRADGIGQRIENARLTDPLTVPPGQMVIQARTLLAGTGLPLIPVPGLTARAAASRTWERGGSRVDAWDELMTAWPATAWIDPDTRAVSVGPPHSTTGTPVMTFTDGDGGSLISVAPGGGPDDGAPNAVVASSAPDDGSVPVSAIATLGYGPMRWDGPYGPRPAFYSSPLLSTPAQVQSAARTRLASMQAEAWDLTIEAVSCPAVQPGDLVRAVSPDTDTDVVGMVTQARVALTPADEPGQIAVRALRGRLGGVEL